MCFIAAEKIGLVMALKPPPSSFAELDSVVQKRLPTAALEATIARVFVSAEDRTNLLVRIVPQSKYKRRRGLLSTKESGRTERLARVVATSDFVWNSEEDVRAFLTTPHPLLERRTPLDVSLTEIGARRVEELLWRLHYGIAA